MTIISIQKINLSILINCWKLKIVYNFQKRFYFYDFYSLQINAFGNLILFLLSPICKISRWEQNNQTHTHARTRRWSTVVRKPCSQLFIFQFPIWFPHLILFRLKKIGWSFRFYLLNSLLLLNINFLYKWDSLAMNRCQNFLSVHLKLLNEKISTINTCKLFSVFIKWKLLDYSFAKNHSQFEAVLFLFKC